MSAVRHALRGARVVTVSGPGGVGKTRLAHEVVGGDVRDDRAVVVELAGLLPAPLQQGRADRRGGLQLGQLLRS